MKKKRSKTRRATDEELLPCMDHLHGDVIDHQFRAACQYEYARESAVLRKAAELQRGEPIPSPSEINSKIEDEFQCRDWLFGTEWMFIWKCPSFPPKSWNQLSKKERTELLPWLPVSATKVQPLTMIPVWVLDTMGIFDEFKAMAEPVRAGRDPKAWYPVIEGWPRPKTENQPLVHALFTLNFTKTKNRLLQEFDEWLQQKGNKALFDKHKPRTEAGTAKQAKDRLKDLAAWKLFRELGWEKALEFAEQHREHDKSGEPRAFHDPRQGRKERGQLKKVPPNQAPLYSWQTGESAFRKAKGRVDRYLAELIPWEFGK